MARYVLFHVGGGMLEFEEQIAKGMKAWEDWEADLGSAITDVGYPLEPMVKGSPTLMGGGEISV